MKPLQLMLSTFMALCTLSATGIAQATAPTFTNLSISELENRLTKIDSQLSSLASYSMRSGLGTGGLRSARQSDARSPIWVQVDLAEETPIDQIILVPVIWRDIHGFKSDGFPVEFKLIAGTRESTNGTVVASYSSEDALLPRIAPVVATFPSISASWVRLEVTELSTRAWDDTYILQLSELFIFNGPNNVALNRMVRIPYDESNIPDNRKKTMLVNGQVPYIMDASSGEKSIAFMSNITGEPSPTLTIDLEEIVPVNRIQMHTLEVTDNVPQCTLPGQGTPIRARLEGATHADFSDAVCLVDYHLNSVFEAAPILMFNFEETACRYIRLVILEPFKGNISSWIGLAEFECFSGGINVAAGKLMQANFNPHHDLRSMAALTDGRNLYGDILPIRDWLEQLATRHDLETERPLVRNERNRRYRAQRSKLQGLIWLAGILAVATAFIIIRGQLQREKIIHNTRERIAANLHDELGANLHAIGLLGDTAKKIVDQKKASAEWEDLIEVVGDIRELTEETGSTARYCTDMLETSGLYKKPVKEMQRVAKRLLADLYHEFIVDHPDELNQLKARKRIDILLFYKECLTNIIRHSGASSACTRLTAHDKKIVLTVSDNGCGTNFIVPPSLKRRARLLGAMVQCEPTGDMGTRVTLTLNLRKGLFDRARA